MNPFRTIFPENMDDTMIQSLFVEEMTNINNVLNENHHIVWGSRGAGKSMLFRYIYSKNPNSYTDFEHFDFSSNRLSIYLKIRQGTLNVKDYLLLDESEAIAISEHMINMHVTQAIIKTLQKIKGIGAEKLIEVVNGIVDSVYDYRIASSIEKADKKFDRQISPLEWLHAVTEEELNKIMYYFRRMKRGEEYSGAYTGYHDYLYSVFKILQSKLCSQPLRFFLLIDDAGNMYPFQQKIINGWISNRDHDILTVKISATKNDYICFNTPDNISIDPSHDFSETELDIIYYGRDDYEERLREIVKKRFETFGMKPISPDALFPEDDAQRALIVECETELRRKYDAKSPNVTWPVYKSRHLMPLVFQKISSKSGKNFSYSGFKNIVNLSSGIVRTFILMSATMWDLAEANLSENTAVDSIPPNIQNKVAQQQAQDFLQNISKIYKDSLFPSGIQNYSEVVGFEIVNKIELLLSSLGSYFRMRLLSPDLSEQIMFSFAVKDPSELTKELRLILNLATTHSYLQRSTNSRKDSGIREEWYILSRRLSPIYNLYTGALKGRVMFSVSDLELAISSTEEFLEKKNPKSRKKNVDTKSQLSLFGENEMEEIEMFYENNERGES